MSYTNLNYHVIFSTKERHCWLKADLMTRLIPYIGGIVRAADGKLVAAGGPEDHIHLAIKLKPTVAPANLVRDVKSNSSGWIHDTFATLRDFWWQKGYAAFSVSQSVLEHVVDYIARQEEHHRKMTYKEELIAFLEKHGIEYDERYLLE
jgi:REP element-mobilizing transposase RayT